MAKLWSPFNRRLAPNGVRNELAGNVSTSADEKPRALAAHWAQVFAEKTTDEAAAERVARDWVSQLCLHAW